MSSAEGIRGAYDAGILTRAVGFSNRQDHVPGRLIRSLRFHPVRMLGSVLSSKPYYGVKKSALDATAARVLERGEFDLFHSWSGDCLQSLIAARQHGVPSVMEVPTWHRNKFHSKPFETGSERRLRNESGFAAWKQKLSVQRARVLTEYELADVMLVQSSMAAESFTELGFPPERIFFVARGVDVERFKPGPQPAKFRLAFLGALIKRKGVHHILKAWHGLNLKDAELVLIGTAHDEMKPYLDKYGGQGVTVMGFCPNPEEVLAGCSAFVFPSECEGSAKATYEGAAAGLAQIGTRESGDVVIDGYNGWVIPANDPDALADAIRDAYQNPVKTEEMGRAARKRVESEFTWGHQRNRVLHAYAYALQLKR